MSFTSKQEGDWATFEIDLTPMFPPHNLPIDGDARQIATTTGIVVTVIVVTVASAVYLTLRRQRRQKQQQLASTARGLVSRGAVQSGPLGDMAAESQPLLAVGSAEEPPRVIKGSPLSIRAHLGASSAKLPKAPASAASTAAPSAFPFSSAAAPRTTSSGLSSPPAAAARRQSAEAAAAGSSAQSPSGGADGSAAALRLGAELDASLHKNPYYRSRRSHAKVRNKWAGGGLCAFFNTSSVPLSLFQLSFSHLPSLSLFF